MHPAGATECLIRFRDSHIVLLGLSGSRNAHRDAQPANKAAAEMIALLAGRQAHLLTYGVRSKDLATTAEFLRQNGLEAHRADHTLERPDGGVWNWSLLIPEGKLWQQPWPFIFQSWLNGIDDTETWLTGRARCTDPHPNGAIGCHGLIVGVESSSARDHLFRQQLGLRSARDGYEVGGFQIGLRQAAPEGIGPQELALRVSDLSIARAYFESAGVDVTAEPGRLMPARDACLGISLSFMAP
jgi:hypothetical protein